MIGPRLQAAGIGFTEVVAHRWNGRVHVVTFVAKTPEDLTKFALWAAGNDVDFDDARIATREELSEAEGWS